LHTTEDDGKTYPLTPDNKRLFKVYIFYRLGLNVLLSTLFLSGMSEGFLGTNNPNLFICAVYFYSGLCLISAISYCLKWLQPKDKHILFLLTSDFIALALMIYSSNTAVGGLGYLLLIPMAIGSTFLRGKTSVGLAAFASILLMAPNLIDILDGHERSQSLFTSGIAGIILFITAISFRLLAKKIQGNEYAIRQQTEITQYVQGINQRIIETIQAGILVVDHELNVLLINNAAQTLLSRNKKFTKIADIHAIKNILGQWKRSQKIPDTAMLNLGVNYDIKISFTELPSPNITSLMLFIEDKIRINKEAQQLKLASLGRLTSSIAHEIRNPLGAISHASQLLDESENITSSDQELLSMIQVNSRRIDQTIKNILQFSRRKKAYTETIDVNTWIEKFISTYQPHTSNNITYTSPHEKIYTTIDPNHLQQIITNLVDNGFRHSQKEELENTVTIELNTQPVTALPYINIIDEGNGISDEHIDTIFEPFFTTKPSGSGLGLYLCKELCQANQADIIYLQKNNTQKSCFRLTLCHPKKEENEQ
jgi:two-component system sensor histidine kinase PilS (NtrC family)